MANRYRTRPMAIWCGNNITIGLYPWEFNKRESQDFLRMFSSKESTTGFQIAGHKHEVQAEIVEFPWYSLISWNKAISSFVKRGYAEKALHMFKKMRQKGVKPDKFTFVSVLNACARLVALEQGREVHAEMIESGIELDTFVWNSLMSMYSKCNCIDDAFEVFNNMPNRDVVSWSIMIAAYSKSNYNEKSFELFEEMQQTVKPDLKTFISVLNVCANLAALDQGKRVHAQMKASGIAFDVSVQTCLVDMYAKCGCLVEACNIFDAMQTRDVIAWNAMIGGYSKNGYGKKALELFDKMQREGVKPNVRTFVGALNACASLVALEQGRRVHDQLIKSGNSLSVFAGTCLVDMYAKCGSIEEARKAFDSMQTRDKVSWNAMIGGYSRCGHYEEALGLFEQMQQEGLKPNNVTFVNLLSAFEGPSALEYGRQVHAQMLQIGVVPDMYSLNSLLNMYTKCGSLEDARKVFDKMKKRDVFSWTAMIGAYSKGYGQKALALFTEMQQDGVEPDNMTFACVFNACAGLAALEQGKQAHSRMIGSGIMPDICTLTSLLDMYAKCGSIEDAREVFDSMNTENSVSWTAMIGGYSMCGYGKEALQLFRQMQEKGMKVDRMTFVCVLSACSHAGLVDEGLRFFDAMIQEYGISPTMEHYACIVDLLGRAGRLNEAEDIINSMPFEPSSVVWMALLGACRVHGNLDVAERAAERVLDLEPHNAAG